MKNYYKTTTELSKLEQILKREEAKKRLGIN